MTNNNTYVTLDSIIRKLLSKSQLTTHFYAPFFLHAKDAVAELFNIHSPQYKVAEITITDGIGDIPADCLVAKEIYIESGDVKKPYIEDISLVPAETMSATEEDVDNWHNRVYQGYSWGAGKNFIRSYVEIPGANKFRLKVDGNDAITKVYMLYTYDNSVIGTSTTVHPFMERPIYDFIRWQRAGHATVKRLDVRILKQEYYNSVGQFRSLISKTTEQVIGRLKRRAKN
jgi:hypothetical protein